MSLLVYKTLDASLVAILVVTLVAIFVIYGTTLILLALFGLHRAHLLWQYLRSRNAQPQRQPLPAELPWVTVQLPLYNERYVAERLIDAVAGLAWPRDRLQIQVLDDSDDDTGAICRRKIDSLRACGYHIDYLPRSDRSGFKAGALQAGLARARGEFVLILDADFLPPADLLRQTVGHFARPEVGMVQVSWGHLNRTRSLLTRIQALLLDGHFVIEQNARQQSGGFFNFNGTAGLWRRSAIDDAGGWRADTLTEDLDLSYRALLCGWRFVFVSQPEAPAELPAAMNGFKSQQYRWAKGSIQVAVAMVPRIWRAALPMRAKIEAIFHLTQNLPYLLLLTMALSLGPVSLWRALTAADHTALGNITIGAITAMDQVLLGATVIVLGLYCAASQWALARSGLAALVLLPAVIALAVGLSLSQSRAVLAGAWKRPSVFVRTPKTGIQAGGLPLKTGPSRQRRARGLRSIRHRYRGARDWAWLVEVLLGGYCLAFLVAIAWAGSWHGVPLLALCGLGFLYVGTASALDGRRRGHGQ